MHALAKERRAKRFQSGALSLNTPKLTFKLDQNGNPVEFASYPIRDSNKLVEVSRDCACTVQYCIAPTLFRVTLKKRVWCPPSLYE